MTTDTTVISRPNPYVGPRAFKSGETMYGRERETSEIIDLLIAERILLLYSPPGAGKSSLLNAAVFPAMNEQGFRVLPIMRANAEPPLGVLQKPSFNRYIYSLMLSLEEGQPEAERFPINDLLGLTFAGYIEMFRQRAVAHDPAFDRSGPMLLILDQTEEVITLTPTDRDKKLEFFAQLGEVLRDRGVWALLAIREDYLPALDPYLRPVPTRLATRYRLNFLEAVAALDAITKPAGRMGVQFDSEAANKLVEGLRLVKVQQPDGTSVDEVGPYVEPVQLQVVCRRLWMTLPRGQQTINNEDIDKAGDINTALADYYALEVASVAAASGTRERAIREWFDRKLITVQGIRGQVLMGPGKSDGLDNATIWLLERAYLVRAEKRGGATWFELAHDRLLGPVRENNAAWFTGHLSNLQKQADLWNNSSRPEGMLFSGADYREADAWAAKHTSAMTDWEHDFLNACHELNARIARERRTNRIIRILFVASVIIGAIALLMFIRATLAEHRAVARELAAASLNNLNVDPELSIYLSLASLDATNPDLVDSIQSLHQALPALRVERQFVGHTNKIYAVAFSPDGNSLASSSQDGTVRIWDVASGKDLQTLAINPDGTSTTAVAYSPDGKWLAATDETGRLLLLDTGTWQPRLNLQAHQEGAWALAYSPDGRLIATGSDDHTARLWNAADGALLHTLGTPDCASQESCGQGHTDKVQAVAFSPDGKLLATGGDDDHIKVWDAQTGAFLYDLGQHDGTVWGLAFRPGSNQLASVSTDRTVKVWDLDTRQLLYTIAAVGGQPGHLDWTYSVAYTPDGKTILTAGADRTVRIWDADFGRSLGTLTGHTLQVYDVAVSPDGTHVATAGEDRTIRYWNISRVGDRELLALDNGDKVYDAVYSPDGTRIASAARDGVVRIWDAGTGAKLAELTGGHTATVEGVAWSPDGSQLTSVARDGKADVWDAASGKVLTTFEKHTGPIWGVAYTPDGKLVATAGDDGTVRLWDPATGQEAHVLSLGDKGGAVVSLSFSADSSELAAGYYETPDATAPHPVVIWDWANEKVLHTLTGHTDVLEGVAFNPVDSNVLASVADDGKLILWNIKAGTGEVYLGHIGTIFDVAFSPDGEHVATAGGDGSVKVWTPGEPAYLNLYGHTGRVLSVAFDPQNPQHILSAGDDFTIRTFTLSVAELTQIAKARLTRPPTQQECQEYNISSDLCVAVGPIQNDATVQPQVLPGPP